MLTQLVFAKLPVTRYWKIPADSRQAPYSSIARSAGICFATLPAWDMRALMSSGFSREEIFWDVIVRTRRRCHGGGDIGMRLRLVQAAKKFVASMMLQQTSSSNSRLRMNRAPAKSLETDRRRLESMCRSPCSKMWIFDNGASSGGDDQIASIVIKSISEIIDAGTTGMRKANGSKHVSLLLLPVVQKPFYSARIARMVWRRGTDLQIDAWACWFAS
ncbi:hypothetical protein BDP81DRAFT_503381 [Colletotrichum phormii]|uniref:Uncharacterized protein n=1 Tax=Colletotrichum phormii TaxID=359342 RepID=A0AAI9ZFL1_9PEZI|nr:uncharacterized protein BDP81DRAFT_503381 [Colletotrichum phormii]KAK1623615.1 hypothetical protein BDP81DRAFT_503381 [Colletotrichum phormii]